MLEYTLQFLLLLLIVIAAYLLYERFVRKKVQPPMAAYVDALRDLLDGKQESAFTKLRQVVTEDTANIDAYLRLGRILRDNKQAERALQVHKDLTLRPDLSRAERIAILREIAADCLAMDDVKLSEKALGEQLSLDPSDYLAHTQMLAIQENAQRWDEAYDTAVKILKLEANKSKRPLARFKYMAADQLLKKREYHKARVIFKEAIGLDPTYVDAYLAIGDSYYEENRHEDAVTFWGKLITSVPDEGHRVIGRLKKTLFALGRYGDIQAICERILEHSPKNLEARRTLAEFYEKKGDVDLALKLGEEIIDDHPEEISITLELIRIYLEREDHKKINSLIKSLERKRDDSRTEPSGESAETLPSPSGSGSSPSGSGS